MFRMPAPGWYPDPSGAPLLRYFDGQHWTPHTAPHPTSSGGGYPQGGYPQGGSPTAPGTTQHGAAAGPGYPYQGQQAGFQQYPGQPGGPPPPAGGRRNMWLWVVFGVLVAMILGVGAWLVFRDVDIPADRPNPTQSVTPPNDPTPGLTTPGTEPGEDSAPPDSTPPEQGVALPPSGTVIEPVTGCPATASDAVGTQREDGRYVSGAGLSMPAADGFVAAPVQYPWVHQSNSQVKQYDNNWMSSITVGTVRAEDGFTETGETALAMAACMLGSEFYVSSDPTATVTGTARAPQTDGVQLSLDVAVPGAEGVTTDILYIMTIKDLGVMHVVIATVPDTDPEAAEALVAVFAGMSVE